MTNMTVDARKLKELLIAASELASEALLRQQGTANAVLQEPKFGGGTFSDSKVAADSKVELLLRDFWLSKLPGCVILGEELGGVYNGQEWGVLIDPNDCTTSYIRGIPAFGPLHGIYYRGKNVAGIEWNATTGTGYVATLETGFERIGPEENIEKNVIHVEGSVKGNIEFAERVGQAMREAFPEYNVFVKVQNVLARARVFCGNWVGTFHAGWAQHDIAAMPVFSEVTRIPATDHNGKPYGNVNFELMAMRYGAANAVPERGKEILYNNPVVIASPEIHRKMLEVLQPFKEILDAKQNAGLFYRSLP